MWFENSANTQNMLRFAGRSYSPNQDCKFGLSAEPTVDDTTLDVWGMRVTTGRDGILRFYHNLCHWDTARGPFPSSASEYKLTGTATGMFQQNY